MIKRTLLLAILVAVIALAADHAHAAGQKFDPDHLLKGAKAVRMDPCPEPYEGVTCVLLQRKVAFFVVLVQRGSPQVIFQVPPSTLKIAPFYYLGLYPKIWKDLRFQNESSGSIT